MEATEAEGKRFLWGVCLLMLVPVLSVLPVLVFTLSLHKNQFLKVSHGLARNKCCLSAALDSKWLQTPPFLITFMYLHVFFWKDFRKDSTLSWAIQKPDSSSEFIRSIPKEYNVTVPYARSTCSTYFLKNFILPTLVDSEISDRQQFFISHNFLFKWNEVETGLKRSLFGLSSQRSTHNGAVCTWELSWKQLKARFQENVPNIFMESFENANTFLITKNHYWKPLYPGHILFDKPWQGAELVVVGLGCRPKLHVWQLASAHRTSKTAKKNNSSKVKKEYLYFSWS